MKKEIYLILHNIRSLYNVGSIFRTADARGVKKIYLTGYTPTPTDRFGKIRTEIHKTSLGAEYTVAWEYYRNIATLIKKLRKEKIFLAAVEQNKRAINYKKLKNLSSVAFIFGNEVRGISPQILKKCDEIVEIPMYGKMVRHAHHPKNYHPEQYRKKESLNVSVTAGIILFSV